MTSRPTRAVILLLGLATLPIHLTAAPDRPRHTIMDLGTLPGDYFSSASDINNHGQVVGWSLGPAGQFRAFLWDEGMMTELPPLAGAQFASAAAINNRGQIVGASGGTASHAVLWDDGATLDLGRLPGATSCSAVDINDRGQIVGSCDVTGARVGFLWHRGRMRPLDALPDADFTNPAALNNHGVVAGGALTPDGAYRAVAWSGPAITDLGTLRGRSNSSADGINDWGDIVGSSDTGSFDPLAVIWKRGSVMSLGTLPGTTWSQAVAINDLRHIVGRSGLTPFIWQDGTMFGLPTLPGGTGIAFAINNRDDIAGQADNANGQPRAVIWSMRERLRRDRTIVWDFGPDTGLATPPDGRGVVLFNASNNQNFVDAVSFRRDMEITGLNVFTSGSHLPFVGTHFRVKILADAGGVPGAPLLEIDVEPTSITFVGLFPAAGGELTDVYRVNLQFPAIALQRHTKYWVGASGLNFDAGAYGVLGAGDGQMFVFSGETMVGPAPSLFGDLMLQLQSARPAR